MIVIFARCIILYIIVFLIMRLSGKRQVSDLQAFDLVITMLIADLASEPATNLNIPLAHGIVPILTLYIIQQIFSEISLKSNKLRKILCGNPIIVVKDGRVLEHSLKSARYSLDDLFEQMRTKDIYDINDVSYAILETNGSLSVLLKGTKQNPTNEDLGLPPSDDNLVNVIISDGKINEKELSASGKTFEWVKTKLKLNGINNVSEVFLMSIDDKNKMFLQTKDKYGGKVIKNGGEG